jgi:hypothetical protein
MVEARCAVPFAEAVLAVDLWLGAIWVQGGELVESRVEGLDTAIEGRGVEALYGWIESDQFLGEFEGLLRAVACKRRVRGDAGGRGDIGVVDAGVAVDDPIRPELSQRRVLDTVSKAVIWMRLTPCRVT